MALEPDPFPAKDRIVDKEGYPTEVFVKYFEGQQQLTLSGSSNLGTVPLTAQGASIPTTELPTGVLGAGLYRISFYMQVTTVAGVSSSVDLTFSWTNAGNPLTTTATMNGNTLATFLSGTIPIHIDADSPISYSAVFASNPAGVMRYLLYIKVERFG